MAPLHKPRAFHVCMSGRLVPANLPGLAAWHTFNAATTLLGQFLSHRCNPQPSRKLPCPAHVAQTSSPAPAPGLTQRYMSALARTWQAPPGIKPVRADSLRPPRASEHKMQSRVITMPQSRIIAMLISSRVFIPLKGLAQLDHDSVIEKGNDERVVVQLPPDYVHDGTTPEGQALEKYALAILKDEEMTRAWIGSLIKYSAAEEQPQQKSPTPESKPAPTPALQEISLTELAQQPTEKWKEAARDVSLKLSLPEKFDFEPGSSEWKCYQAYLVARKEHLQEIAPPKQTATTTIGLVALSRMRPDAWEYVATSPKFKVEIPEFDTLDASTDFRQVYACLSKYVETLEKQLPLAGKTDDMNQ
jgi:hypothetical protein